MENKNLTPLTKAEQIADRLFNDGQNFSDEKGHDLAEICTVDFDANYQQNVSYVNDITDDFGVFDEVYSFCDGSYLAICGGAWDISSDDGTSWEGCKLA